MRRYIVFLLLLIVPLFVVGQGKQKQKQSMGKQVESVMSDLDSMLTYLRAKKIAKGCGRTDSLYIAMCFDSLMAIKDSLRVKVR